MSSIYGKNLKVSIFGQSHSSAIGVSIDGLPAGLKIDTDRIASFLQRRAPGNNTYSTKRREADIPEILCGLIDGKTCGAPLAAIIRNTDTRSKDYENICDVPRPSHADYTAEIKYHGAQDVAGGGHFSGRLTAPLCIAGAICLQALEQEGISVAAHIASIAGIEDDSFDLADVSLRDFSRLRCNPFPVLNAEKGDKMLAEIEAARLDGDSVGGIIECAVLGLPVGVGEPMFDGMENRISSMLFGIPAVKGIEFGNGFACTTMRGSQNNDTFYMENGIVRTRTNNHGGILGGITSGMPLVFRAAIKPTPSISQEQDSISLSKMKNERLTIKGRHDPCIVPRAVPCIEAAAAIATYDSILTVRK